MDIVIVVMWKATDRDMMELSDSEMTKRVGEQRHEVNKELKHLLGLVGDPQLQQAVHVFHDLWLTATDQVMGPVTDKKRKTDPEAVPDAFKYLGRLRRATTDIRNAALPLVQVSIEDPQPVRWCRSSAGERRGVCRAHVPTVGETTEPPASRPRARVARSCSGQPVHLRKRSNSSPTGPRGMSWAAFSR